VPEAIRLAYLLSGDRMLAEDIAQDAFVRLAGRFDHLRRPQAFPAYLRKTVVNLAMNHFRRERLERSYLGEAGPLIKGVPSVDVADAETLRSALLALPYRQRAAIVLRYYEDLSEQRTADLLGCRPGTVKSLTSRGIGALRMAIGSDLGEPP
jgi:RNA polymerase sigma-70 factor (sigma-E family)